MKLLSTLSLLFITIVALCLSSTLTTIHALTTAQRNQLASDLSYYNQFVTSAITAFRNQLATNGGGDCQLTVACDPNVNVSFINFTEYIPGEYGNVQIKEYVDQNVSAASTSSTLREKACDITRMESTWLQNYNTSQSAGKPVLYQYATFPNNLVGFYPQSDWNCTPEARIYTPTERPFYVSGATGQKDTIILLDASSNDPNSAWRLETEKKLAKQIVRGLSFRDFVAIVPFGFSPNRRMTIMLRANEANIPTLLGIIDNVTLMPNNGTNLGAAVEFATTVLRNSRNAGQVSGCTRTIVLLSSGTNDQRFPQPAIPLRDNPDVIIFPFLVTQAVTPEKRLLMLQLACGTNSISRIVTGDNQGNISQVTAITDYFSKLMSRTVIRNSEIYEDALNQGQIYSSSAPVFVTDSTTQLNSLAAIVTVDISKSSIDQGGTLNASDINDFILSRQTCTPLGQRGESNAGIINTLQEGICGAVDSDSIGFGQASDGEQLGVKKAMPAIITFSVIGFIAIGCGACVLNFHYLKKDSWFYSKKTWPMLIFFLVGVYIIVGIVALAVGFAVWVPKQIKYDNYVPTEVTFLSTTVEPYPCCEIVAADCSNVYEVPFCSVLISDKVSEEPFQKGQQYSCSGGYFCCQYEERPCSSSRNNRAAIAEEATTDDLVGSKKDSRRRFSNLDDGGDECYETVCVRDVRSRNSTVRCDTCYGLRTDFVYTYEGSRYQSSWQRTCRLVDNEIQCRDDWIEQHPDRGTQEAWVNPERPSEVVRNLEKPNAGVFAIPFGIAMGAVFIAYLLILKYALTK